MYSYEQRKKAVELYIKFDKSASAVLRELGYPDTKTLKAWYLEYLEKGDLHVKHRLLYTAEQRAAAVQYYKEHGRSLARTSRALGYPCKQLLGEWVHEDLPADYHPLRRGKAVVEYTDKQEMDAVVSVASGEKTAKQLQAEIGVTPSTVHQWKRQLLGEGDNPEMKEKPPQEPATAPSDQESDLRAECIELREERDRQQK